MAVNSVASSNVNIQTTPPRQPEPVARQAEPVAPAPVQQQQPPPQPMVNTSGQRLGSMINTTA